MWQTPTGTVPYEYATFSVDDDRDDKMMFFEKMPSVCLNYDTFYTEKSLAMDITGDTKVYFSISVGSYIYPFGSYLKLVYDVTNKKSTQVLIDPAGTAVAVEMASIAETQLVETDRKKGAKRAKAKKFLDEIKQNNFYWKADKTQMMELYGHRIERINSKRTSDNNGGKPEEPPPKKKKTPPQTDTERMDEMLCMINDLKEKVRTRPETYDDEPVILTEQVSTNAEVGASAIVAGTAKSCVFDKFTAFNMFSQMGLRLGRNNLEMYDTTTLQPVVKYMALITGVERFTNNRYDFDEMELFGLYDGQEAPPFGGSGKGLVNTTGWYNHVNRFSPSETYRLTMNLPFKYLSDFFCGHSLLLPMFLIRMEFTQSEIWKRLIVQRSCVGDAGAGEAASLDPTFSMKIVRSECHAIMYAFIVDADVASTLEDEAERGVGTPYYYTYHSVLEKDHIKGTSLIHQSIVETSTSVPPILIVGFVPTTSLSGDAPAEIGDTVESTKVGINSSIFNFMDVDPTTITLSITNPFPQNRTYELKSIAQRVDFAKVAAGTGNSFGGYENVELYADLKHMAIHGRADYNGYPFMRPSGFGLNCGNPCGKAPPKLPILPAENLYDPFALDHVGTNNLYVYHLSPNGPLEQWNISAVFDGKVEMKLVLASPLPVDVRMIMVLSFPRLGMFQGSREVLTDPTFLHKQALSSVNDGGPHTREGYR